MGRRHGGRDGGAVDRGRRRRLPCGQWIRTVYRIPAVRLTRGIYGVCTEYYLVSSLGGRGGGGRGLGIYLIWGSEGMEMEMRWRRRQPWQPCRHQQAGQGQPRHLGVGVGIGGLEPSRASRASHSLQLQCPPARLLAHMGMASWITKALVGLTNERGCVPARLTL